MATEPTENFWHSGTDALWASSAAVADASSAANDGEKIAGHLNNTGYTSGRANWAWNTVADWLQRVRDTLLPQHADNGDHVAVVVTPSAAAQIDLDAKSHAGDAATDIKLQVRNAAAAVSFSVNSQGDADGRAFSGRSGQFNGDGTASVTGKLKASANAADADSIEQFQLVDQAAATVVKMYSTGYVQASGFGENARTLHLGPGDFEPLSPFAGDSTNFDRAYGNADGTEYLRSANADSTRRFFISKSIPVPRGSKITDVYVRMERFVAGQECLVDLRYKDFDDDLSASATTAGSSGATTGEGTESSTGLTLVVPDGSLDKRSYYAVLALDNDGSVVGDAIRFIGLELVYAANV